jgi:hypothetical protein
VPSRMKERSKCELPSPSIHAIHDDLRSQSAAASASESNTRSG